MNNVIALYPYFRGYYGQWVELVRFNKENERFNKPKDSAVKREPRKTKEK